MTDEVSGQTTEANYERWHERLEERTRLTPTFNRALLISELLGPDDGPHPDKWKPREAD